MAAYLKSESPPQIVAAVQEIENAADLSYKDLALLSFAPDLAGWAVLTGVVVEVERTIATKGFASQAQGNAMINLSRAGAQSIDWIRQHGNPEPTEQGSLNWIPSLAEATRAALSAAHRYEAFKTSFPLWHKSILRAELITAECVRFTPQKGEYQGRVRAYQQGLRPPGATRPQPRSSLSLSTETEASVNKKIANLVANAKGNEFSFSYGKPNKLWKQLYDEYLGLLASLFRRDDDLLISTYTLKQFRQLFAAVLAICAVHELACYWRMQAIGHYPVNSAVLTLRRQEWMKRITKLTALPNEILDAALSDLTFGATKILDLFVHPFLPLGPGTTLLGVIPHFPLKSRPDENIIRVSSHLRPKIHDTLTKAKEDEMRSELEKRCPPSRRPRGPKSLPGGLPDIDLTLEDETAAVIAELKWLRKTMRPTEHPERQKEFLLAVNQLNQIRAFLDGNPDYLFKTGILSKPLRDFQRIYYAIIARDYFIWLDPKTSFPVIDYDEFVRSLEQKQTLTEAMETLLRFDWLPLKDRDFTVQYDRETVNGACIETEVIYPAY